MKIICSRPALAAALKTCASVADAKSSMPVLSMVRLTWAGTRLRCAATDLNVAVTVELDCAGDGDGCDLLVPAAAFAKAIHLLPGAEAVLTLNGSLLTAKAGKATQTVPLGPPATNHPKVPVVDVAWQQVGAAELGAVLRGCLPAVCHDQSRFHLNGILLSAIGGVLRGIATDGHRAHQLHRACTATIPPAIIPLEGCERIVAMLDDAENVKVACVPRYRHLRAGAVTLSVKLIDAQFPPVDQVIPPYEGNGVVLDRASLSSAVKRAGLAVSTTGMRITLGPDGITLASRTAEGHAAEDSFDVDTHGVELVTGVNPKYLADAARSLGDDAIALRFGGPLDPIAVTPAGQPVARDAGDLVVIMPLSPNAGPVQRPVQNGER